MVLLATVWKKVVIIYFMVGLMSLPCHRLCNKCHGNLQTHCDECVTTVFNLDNIRGNTCDCIEGYFYNQTQPILVQSCQACYEFCSSCVTSYNNCQSCITNNRNKLVGSSCLCNVLGYFVYWNTSLSIDQCVRCHPLCLTCTGPYNTQYTLSSVFGVISELTK